MIRNIYSIYHYNDFPLVWASKSADPAFTSSSSAISGKIGKYWSTNNGIVPYLVQHELSGNGIIIGYNYTSGEYGAQIRLKYNNTFAVRYYINGTWSDWEAIGLAKNIGIKWSQKSITKNTSATFADNIMWYLIGGGSSGGGEGCLIYWSAHATSNPTYIGSAPGDVTFSRDAEGNHIISNGRAYSIIVYYIG